MSPSFPIDCSNTSETANRSSLEIRHDERSVEPSLAQDRDRSGHAGGGSWQVTIRLDQAGEVEDARFHVVEFRGFERFIRGRMYWEVPLIIQRLCGICPVSHHLAAAKAMDMAIGVERLTPTAEKMRRLMH